MDSSSILYSSAWHSAGTKFTQLAASGTILQAAFVL